ncbi:Na(+)/H(+) antiporter subunit C [Saccharibacillus sp. CPCC 101409]|uniref:Na(+)/H(+) antiporter subunit C n=1 Tax=Saccharibacillus sp. CPCC 101409 TaxID=3058041 RepID=UPI002673537D|nr:Na(+)/H(+) antiporter subunit C [Saccharibacillus sp. CPCC 101409]MDO3410224.1 Na(+)/H(+) antiporter subunit C [Saccharibacillus sp. CPCC 101409]
MEVIAAVVVGILFAVGIYLILTQDLLRIVLGTSLMTHAVHLLLMAMAGLKGGAAPLLDRGKEEFADPLPQALILTSIVINFGITAFFLVLSYRAYQKLDTTDMDQLRSESSRHRGRSR